MLFTDVYNVLLIKGLDQHNVIVYTLKNYWYWITCPFLLYRNLYIYNTVTNLLEICFWLKKNINVEIVFYFTKLL